MHSIVVDGAKELLCDYFVKNVSDKYDGSSGELSFQEGRKSFSFRLSKVNSLTDFSFLLYLLSLSDVDQGNMKAITARKSSLAREKQRPLMIVVLFDDSTKEKGVMKLQGVEQYLREKQIPSMVLVQNSLEFVSDFKEKFMQIASPVLNQSNNSRTEPVN